MAADDYSEKIRVWRASSVFGFVNKFFYQKIQHRVLVMEVQFVLSILWLWQLKISVKSKKNGQKV